MIFSLFEKWPYWLYLVLALIALIFVETIWAEWLIETEPEQYFKRTFRPLITQGLFLQLLFAVVIIPLVETFLFQHLPITYILNRRFGNILALIISSSLFCMVHFINSDIYPLLIFPGAVVLSYTYLIFHKKNKTGFLMTWCLHAFYNLWFILSINFFI